MLTYKAKKLDKFRLITENLMVISIQTYVTLHSRKSIFVTQSCKKELLRWFYPISHI